MLVQEKLLQLYVSRDLAVTTGAMMAHGGDLAREFTSLWRGGQRLGTGFGMALPELAVFDFTAAVWKPRRIFGIGVAFGWSTVALRLFFPDAVMACLDAGTEGTDNMAGITLTRDILAEIGPAAIELGFSPKDTPRVVETHLEGRINLAFIDGLHSNAQQTADFESIRPYLDTDHVVFFHDVRFCKMEQSFQQIAAAYGDRAVVLARTTSGIGVVYSESMRFRMGRLVALFEGKPVSLPPA